MMVWTSTGRVSEAMHPEELKSSMSPVMKLGIGFRGGMVNLLAGRENVGWVNRFEEEKRNVLVGD